MIVIVLDDGFISADEYINVMKANYVSIDIERERMIAAFSVFDVNGDGKITLEEIRNVLKYKDDSLSTVDIETLFREIDASNQGYIDFTGRSRPMLSNTYKRRNKPGAC